MHQRIIFGNVSPNDYRIHDSGWDCKMEKCGQVGRPNIHTSNALHLDIGRKSMEVKVSQKKLK